MLALLLQHNGCKYILCCMLHIILKKRGNCFGFIMSQIYIMACIVDAGGSSTREISGTFITFVLCPLSYRLLNFLSERTTHTHCSDAWLRSQHIVSLLILLSLGCHDDQAVPSWPMLHFATPTPRKREGEKEMECACGICEPKGCGEMTQ